MGSGYVLNFIDRTFGEFFDEYRVTIDADHYHANGTSKANRMRTFWARDANHIVGRVIAGLIEYGLEERLLPDDANLVEDCRRIAQRLLSDQPVPEIDALTATSDDRDFDVLAQHVRDAIEKNQPEGALDRLHTFVLKYVRVLCQQRQIEINRDKPLHSLFGEYVKHLKEAGQLHAPMTERILRSSISVLDAFNDVRNNRSLAHDNPTLNYEESLLILNHVAATIRFIRSIETKTVATPGAAALDDDIAF